jgi:hypothetical protein
MIAAAALSVAMLLAVTNPSPEDMAQYGGCF